MATQFYHTLLASMLSLAKGLSVLGLSSFENESGPLTLEAMPVFLCQNRLRKGFQKQYRRFNPIKYEEHLQPTYRR